jgi:hypothetical protein
VTGVRRIEDVEELRALVTLADVIYYELHGRRRDGFDNDPQLAQGTNVMQLAESDRFSTRFRTVVQVPDGTYVVDLAVVFTLPEPTEVDPEVMRIFAGTVAFPIAHPFAREALRDLASRLGLKRPILQLLPPTGIELDESYPHQAADR